CRENRPAGRRLRSVPAKHHQQQPREGPHLLRTGHVVRDSDRHQRRRPGGRSVRGYRELVRQEASDRPRWGRAGWLELSDQPGVLRHVRVPLPRWSARSLLILSRASGNWAALPGPPFFGRALERKVGWVMLGECK